MRITGLPTPGPLSVAVELRRVAAFAISSLEIVAMRAPSHKVSWAGQLQTFFTACAAACAPYVQATLTVVSRVANSATQVTVTFSGPLDAATPAPSAFALTGGAVVTGVTVVGSTVVLAGTGMAVGQTLTYTAPVTGFLRDSTGVAIANFTGVLA